MTQEVFRNSDAHFLIKKEVDSIKEELSEHLDSINDNTNELHANYEYLCRLDAKIEKVNEKLEQLMLMLKQSGIEQPEAAVETELTSQEKKVFLMLYTASKALTYSEIAQSLKQEEHLIAEYITNLIEKGVPIKKRYFNKVVYLTLDSDFRDLQAKQNLLKISQTTVKQFV